MRAVHLIITAAVLAFAPMALAQTDTAPPAEVVAETPTEPVAPPAEVTAPAPEEGTPSEAAAAPEPERVCRTQAEWDALQARNGQSGGAQPDNN